MKIEAVTVCVDYADFLAHTILWNKPQFDRWVVVTTPQDKRTIELCAHHNVECATTEDFYKGDRAFAKAAGINVGLDRLRRDGWVVHLDADIAMPPRSKQMIERAALNPQAIYGADRLLCESFDDWLNYLAAPEVMHTLETFVNGNAFRLGTRVGYLGSDGWAPIGFFQLWHPGGSLVRFYPDHGNADRGDMIFARAWPRELRHLIAEFFVIHLASVAETKMGANWRGRRSPHFGPEPCREPRDPYCNPQGYPRR